MLRKLRDRIVDYLQESAQGTPFDLPLFPLHTVLFPGGMLRLRVFEPRYMDMAKACLKADRPFGVCLIREGAEGGEAATPHAVGTTARITDWHMQAVGELHLTVVGGQRFQVLANQAQADGWVVAKARLLPVEPPLALPSKHAACADVLRAIVQQVGEERFQPPLAFDDAVWLGYRLAEMLPLKLAAKQSMLEMNDSRVRLEILHRFLGQQGLAT
ncbi:LON peptidase substrate-binding domain-containing protein [Thiobacter aerophilum]|uniref:LON peptidase substrate-binding domain-containing protein n=1 Tax=Thiobacter aerophilum TaxID=3121275 RepID=A0ABV0EC85_9BURK